MPVRDQTSRPAQLPSAAAPALLIFPLIYAGLLLTHLPLLHLPYWWDEAGYYIPAAWDFFRTGTLIPHSTLSNAHPPLPSLYLALWWRLLGFAPIVTRVAMAAAAALALTAVWRLASLLLPARSSRQGSLHALAAVALTALYPVWFVQSTLAHADLLAATGTLWGLVFYFRSEVPTAGSSPRALALVRSLAPAVVSFSLAALAKEIAISYPLTLAAYEVWLAASAKPSRAREPGCHEPAPAPPGRKRARVKHREGAALYHSSSATQTPVVSHEHTTDRTAPHLLRAALLLIPMLPLALWFAYHRARTGFTFGNPEYLRYNATSTLTPLRIALALSERALHLTAHLNLFVPVIITLGALALPRRADAPPRPRYRALLLTLLLTHWILFSVVGGALLTRYLLPLYPLLLLLCLGVWQERLPTLLPFAALTALAFTLGFLINPPYRFAPEDTLAYRDSILLEEHAIAFLEAWYGHPTVLTAWPASDALAKPELGYTSDAFPVVAIDNFSLPEIERAAHSPTPYVTALVFSTKYDPPRTLLSLLPAPLAQRKQALDDRYFGFHHDLPPELIARLLDGDVVWHEERGGQWAAVLRFHRPTVAALPPPLSQSTLRPKATPAPPRGAPSAQNAFDFASSEALPTRL